MAVQAANMVVIISRIKTKVMITTMRIELIFFFLSFVSLLPLPLPPTPVAPHLFWNRPHYFLEQQRSQTYGAVPCGHCLNLIRVELNEAQETLSLHFSCFSQRLVGRELRVYDRQAASHHTGSAPYNCG